MEKHTEDRGSSKKKLLVVLALVIVVIIMLLVFHSCSNSKVLDNGNVDAVNTNKEEVIDNKAPIGNFDVSDSKQEVEPKEDPNNEPVETITFSGYGEYVVSEENPKIELSNPKVNKVNMVYTLTDKETDEIIARTNEIKPGEYVYIDVTEYFKEPGTYNVAVVIDTFTNEGVQMNGLNQEMVIKYT